MQGLAEVEGNPMKIKEASQKIERDIGPLSREVALQLRGGNGNANGNAAEAGGREELFFQAPGMNGNGNVRAADNYGYNSGSSDIMESLIGSSEDMLRESLS